MAFTLRIITRLFVVLSLGLSCVYAARDLRELASTETGTYTVPTVPDVMKVPAGYKLHLKLFGEGHQYYRFNGSNWVQFSAYASLYDEERKEIGHHYYLTHPALVANEVFSRERRSRFLWISRDGTPRAISEEFPEN